MNIPSQVITWWLSGQKLEGYPEYKMSQYLTRYKNQQWFRFIGWICLAAALLYSAMSGNIVLINRGIDNDHYVWLDIGLYITFILSRLAFRLDAAELNLVQTLRADYKNLRKLCLYNKSRLSQVGLVHKELQAVLHSTNTRPTPALCGRAPIPLNTTMSQLDKKPTYSYCAFYAWLEARNLARAQQVAEQEVQFLNRDTSKPDSASEKKTRLKEALTAAIKIMKKFGLADGSEESIQRMCFHPQGPGKIWTN